MISAEFNWTNPSDYNKYSTPSFESLLELGVDKKYLFDYVITIHKRLGEQLRINPNVIANRMIRYAKNNGVCHLIEFFPSKNADNSLCVGNKAVYREFFDMYGRRYNEYYDVYIHENRHIETIMSEIIKEVLFDYYTFIFNNPLFQHTELKYKNEKIFELTKDTKLKDIDSILYQHKGFNTLTDDTIGDLIKVLNGEEDKTTQEITSLFKIYVIGGKISIYLELTEDYSLSIPLNAIINQDWKLVENVEVYSIKTNRVGIWFSGKQKDAPYFNHPLVEEFKKCVLL